MFYNSCLLIFEHTIDEKIEAFVSSIPKDLLEEKSAQDQKKQLKKTAITLFQSLITAAIKSPSKSFAERKGTV